MRRATSRTSGNLVLFAPHHLAIGDALPQPGVVGNRTDVTHLIEHEFQMLPLVLGGHN